MVTLIHMLIPPKQLNQWHGFWAGLHLIRGSLWETSFIHFESLFKL